MQTRLPADPRPGAAPFVSVQFRRFAMVGVADGDSEDDRLRKATITLASALTAVMAIVWVATYWSLGLWRSGAIPFTYQVVTVIGLVVFARTKRLTPFCAVELGMMLALPFALRYFADYSEDQIAATLGLANGTVKSHLHRGIDRLRRGLVER